MKIRRFATRLALTAFWASAGNAAPAQQLRCIDDQLSDAQRAGVAEMFAPQTDDPLLVRKPPRGSASAAQDLAVTLGSCAQQFGWSQPAQRLATEYLMRLGAVSKLRLGHLPDWSNVLDRFYPSVSKQLAVDGELTDYAITSIAAGARANGLPTESAAPGDGADPNKAIVEYLLAVKGVETAKANFASSAG